MGRLGPLTSLALGRSPHDDVVQGEGAPNPREPEHEYDERGRIVNAETRRRMKDLIRAHNEVMTVIGIAEHDPNDDKEAVKLVNMVREHQEYQSDTGRTLRNLGHDLYGCSLNGVLSARHRILVYRPYSHIHFSRLLSFERSRQSVSQLLWAGLPAHLGTLASRIVKEHYYGKTWLRLGFSWVELNLRIFMTMQRLGLIPSSQWLPAYHFFIPFSHSSPFTAPPPIMSWSAVSIGVWLGRLALNLAPFSAFYLSALTRSFCFAALWPRIYECVPRPTSASASVKRVAEEQAAREQTARLVQAPGQATVSPTLGAADAAIRNPRTGSQPLQQQQQQQQHQAETSEAGGRGGALRRQSTISSRGGEHDYATDEEDADMVNPTLISFDVDTTESVEQPAGVWSAELRPSPASDGRAVAKEGPVYQINELTVMPAQLAADILANTLTRLICSPVDAWALRWEARAYARGHGLSTQDMFPVGLRGSFSWMHVTSLLGLELVGLFISGEIWAVMTLLAQALSLSWEEYKQMVGNEENNSLGRHDSPDTEST